MTEHAGVRVSVLIPAFNSAAWIGETLESVLGQSHSLLDVIVADNGSTDDTRAIVASFGSRVRLVHAAERGAGAARNAALEAARGDVLQFLDADDLLEPNKIERQLRVLQATGADVVWGPFWRYEERAAGSFVKAKRVDPAIGSDVAASILGPSGFIQIGAALIRRSPRMDDLRFDNVGAAPVEDVRYLLELALRGCVFVRGDGDSGLLFRQHALARWSHAAPSRFWSGCVVTAGVAERRWRDTETLTASRRAVLVEVYANAARAFFVDSPERFREVCARAQALDPRWHRRLPRRLSVLASIIGIANAEAIATLYRAVRRRIRVRGAAASVGTSVS